MLLAGVMVRGAAAHDPITTRVTFDREIRAILQARCASCHTRGGPAPMPLTTYEEVRPWARGIKDQVLRRRMPKWHAAHGYGAFANDPSLTPTEMALVAAWVDGGQPRTAGSTGSPRSTGSTASAGSVRSAAERNSPALAVAASASLGLLPTTIRWLAGWSFEPGDPLITSATFTSADGATVGAWVAGDGPVVLPAGAALRIRSPVAVSIQRRRAADYDKPFTAVASLLRLIPGGAAPPRRAWVERMACGTPRIGPAAEVLAVRPLLAEGASARLWIERPGAPRTIVGWFREFETLYPRTYWLARASDLPPESRFQSDAPCTVELTLAAR